MGQNEFAVSVELRANAQQYTAEFKGAGQTAQEFAAQVASSSTTAATAVQSAAKEAGTLGQVTSAAAGQAAQALQATVPSAQAVGTALQSVGDKATSALGQAAQAGKVAQASVAQVGAASTSTGAAVQAAAAQVGTLGQAAQTASNQTAAALKSTIPAAQSLGSAMQNVGAATGMAEAKTQQLGMSARATAAALRGVPAQITDIVVSLQGGMSPITVLMQQGGQLRDMFGGIVPAARALGSVVLSMVNPFTLTAGAVAVLTFAYLSGKGEADGYTRSIALSGNAAGTTAAQMQQAAKAVSDSVGTQREASRVIAELGESGKVAGSDLQRFAETTIRMERDVGVAVKDTVKAFVDLGEKPVEASLKLNERHNYLTKAVYDQIKALQEQGRVTEAAAVAQQAYDHAMARVADTMQGRLGYLERAWRGLGDSAKWAWDKMLGIGRDDTMLSQLESKRADLADRMQRGPLNEGVRANWEKGNARLREEIGLLQEQERMQKRGAEAEAQRAANERLYFDWDKQGDAFRSKAAKRDEEIRKAEAEGQQLLTAGLITEAGLRERLAAIREKYKDPKATGGISATDGQVAALNAQLDAARAYYQQLVTNGAQADELNAGERESLRLAEQIKLATDAKTIAKLKEMQATADALAVQLRTNHGLREAVVAHQKLIDATEQSARSLDKRAAQQEAANAAFGKGRTAIEALTLATLQHQLTEAQSSNSFDPKYIATLQRKTEAQKRYVEALQEADGKAGMARVNEMVRSAEELAKVYADELALSGMTALEREKIVAQRQIELKYAKAIAEVNRSDATEESKAAQRAELERSKRIESEVTSAKIIQADWAKGSDEINRSLTDALMRGAEAGKGFFQNLRDTVKNMFDTLVLRPVISAIMQPVSLVINGIVGGALNSLGLGSGGSAGGLLSNAGSLVSLGSGATQLMAGYQGASLAAGLAGPTTAGASGMMGVGNMLAAVPGWGWALAGIAALAGLASSFKGETRTGGQFGVAFDGSVTNNRRGQSYTYVGQQYDRDFSGGQRIGLTDGEAYRLEGDKVNDEDTIRQAISGTARGINEMLKGIGSAVRLTDFFGGFETSSKDRGGVFAGGKLSNGATFGESGEGDNYAGTLYELFSTRSPDYKTAIENFSLDLKQSAIQAIQKVTDGPEVIQKMVKGVNAEGLTSEAADQLLTAINTQIAGVTAFKDAVNAMGLTSLADMSFDAASGIAELSGGFEQLQGRLSSYYANYFSEEERRANAQRMMAEQLATLDLKLPDINADDARAQLRAMIEAQDENTEAGRKAIAMLLALEGTFASVTVSGEEVARRNAERQAQIADKGRDLEQRLLIAQGKDREALDLRRLQEYYALLNLNPALAAMVIEIYKAEDAAEAARKAEEERRQAEEARAAATDKAYAVLEKSVSAAQEAVQAEIELREARVSSAKELVELARNQARELRGQVAATAAMQAAEGSAAIDQALAALRSGQRVNEDGKLAEAITAARGGITERAFTNRLDYEAAQLMLANKLDAMGDLGQAQLSTEELLLNASKAEADRLDQLLKASKDALDMARGQYVGILDTATAVRNFQAALLAEKPGAQVPGSGSGSGSGGAVFGGTAGGDVQSTRPTTAPAKYFDLQYLGTAGVGRVGITDASITARLDALAPTYHSFDGTGDLGGLMAAMQAQGATLRDMSRLSGYWESDWAKVQDQVGSNLPAFDVGINRVPYDMQARIHKDEAILPARFNPFNPGADLPWGMGSDNSAVVSALQGLQQQQYDLLRVVIERIGSVDTTVRKLDAQGIKIRTAEPA
ncbi:hypothetical protein AVHY2522_19220 [Acidovorax sp. SUPP2522]|uniref:phage tail length tape measure family protein n=1 Tax=unclassified Acidovorax TaxID=2684926 RepID=UPI00234BC2B9|nr:MULTISPECIES: phage tail length tape measure family protein [unclassified Acidovorax]WCM99986.1 phage tail length tape measure family protein [Acidovorax sp. GBBC 1281]GKT18548.1 hypothetical protein AVHY2522_19220 [Acidovorax sp. SUPP2522]